MTVLSPKSLITLLFAILLCLPAFAQKKGVSKVHIHKQMQLVDIKEHNLKSANFFTQRAAIMGLGAEDEMILKTELSGKNNYRYEKYEQHYKGIPVFGSAYTLRIQEGIVKRASGYYLPLIDLSIEPDISEKKALRIAMGEMKAEIYAWEDNALKKIPGYAQAPEAKLVIIDKTYPAASEYYKLAYQVDLHSSQPFDKKRYFVDAQTGKILLDLPLLMHQSVPGKGQCKYYGEQSFTVDSISANQFVLRDLSRGDGNTVFGPSGEVYTDTDNYWDLNSDGEAEIAIDAHYCTEKFYDFMLNTFNWNGIDNQGGSMNCVVHAGDFVNAFWDGVSASFGDGDCNRGPLTTLEVVAHEFMHGITDYTSDLIYQGESGAINESMSDVFGKGLEFYEDPDNFVWTIGQSFVETQYARPFRSFENPNEFGHPSFYNGLFWSPSGGVHTNSSIGNHWFYLLVNGGTGTTENGGEYNIQGLGMEKALDVVFLTQATALTPNSTYSFYKETSIIIAEELYGPGSAEVSDVQEAWGAVGIVPAPLQEVLSLEFSFEETFITTCLNNEFLTFDFKISNSGDVAYQPEMEGEIELIYYDESFTPNTKIITIDDEILPGESISFSVEDLVFLSANAFTFLDLFLTANNADLFETEFVLISNSTSVKDDLSLSNAVQSLNPLLTCFDIEQSIIVFITNSSCTTLSGGTPFSLNIYDENETLISTNSHNLPYNLFPNENFFLEEGIDFFTINSEFIRVELDYAEDVNVENNSFILNVPNGGTIDSQHLEEFENSEFEKITITNEFEGSARYPFSYQNENYIAISGSAFSNNSLCPNPEDYFNDARLSIQACIDASNLQNPILSFDLIQFRDQSIVEFPELINLSNITSVKWSDGQNDFEEYIFGQEEGEKVSHQFELPANAIGVVTIEFFHQTGNSDFDNLFSSDITLLDNFAIDDIVVSVENSAIQSFDIIPNPTSGIITLNYIDVPDALIVKNIHGQEVLNIAPNPNSQEINLSHLPDGYYPVSLIYQDKVATSLISKVGN